MNELQKIVQEAYPENLPRLWIQTAFQRLFKSLSTAQPQEKTQPLCDVQHTVNLLKGEDVQVSKPVAIASSFMRSRHEAAFNKGWQDK